MYETEFGASDLKMSPCMLILVKNLKPYEGFTQIIANYSNKTHAFKSNVFLA